jgi:hypothetical protein
MSRGLLAKQYSFKRPLTVIVLSDTFENIGIFKNGLFRRTGTTASSLPHCSERRGCDLKTLLTPSRSGVIHCSSLLLTLLNDTDGRHDHKGGEDCLRIECCLAHFLDLRLQSLVKIPTLWLCLILFPMQVL